MNAIKKIYLTLSEVSDCNGCRWPVNEPKRGEDYLFCGAKKKSGKSYCSRHALMSVDRSRRKPKMEEAA